MDDLDLGATIKGFSPGQKIFNRYTLGRILGRGGMGVVWLVRDASMERDIAIKMLPEVVANDPSAIRELKRETSRSQQLSHANILRIYDFAEGAGACGITMELVDGHTLASLRHERPGEIFSVEELTPVVRQLCAALEYAHTDARIVHRDLKPSNLMLDRTGRLKVMDFGIAASLSESVSRVSNRASTSGSPGYMSPQQWRGIDPTESDDLYALGATLYELLAGQPPFKSPQPAALMHQVLHEPPLPLNARRAKTGQPPVPAAWEETIMALLAKEPGDRPSSAGEVAERLGLGGLTTKSAKVGRVVPNAPSASPPIPDPKSKTPTKTPTKTPLIAGIVAVVLLLAGLGYYFGVYAPEQTRLAAEQKQRAAEQARLAEIKRLEDEGKAAEAQKLKNQQELAAAEAKAQSERERLAAERLAAARGGIVVRTTPAGAEVRVGAIALEKSPLTLKDQKLGKYPVRVRLDGYEEWTGEVEVKENDFADLDVALIRSTGTLLLTSDPAGLEVTVVGAVAPNGLAPAAPQNVRTPNQLKLPTGTYELTFRRAGWLQQEQTIEVARNQAITATAEFAVGSLELTSTPAGAEVWHGGKKFGTTPYKMADTIPGRYDFELKLKGYQPATASLTVAARQTARESVILEKQPYPQPGQPWENTLGQKFVPVPGTGVLFCIWETRVQDYLAFSQATRREWSKSGEAAHPAVNVSWDDAQAFCAWLTQQEQAVGRLGPDQKYRLPTDAEWSLAVGLTNEGSGSPQSKDGKTPNVYPWGPQWPPPRGAGNYGASLKVDSFDGTAPVGSFAANRHGLYDLGGNVAEWCDDFYDGSSDWRVLRDVSFSDYAAVYLLSSDRSRVPSDLRSNLAGFRVVVLVGGASSF